MAASFDSDKYFSAGEWKVAANSASSHYEKLGFSSGDTLSEKQVIEAFHLREDWWTQKDKIARRGQAHPVIKEVGPFIQDAIKNLLEAKSILSDPIRKAQYDKKLKDEIAKKAEEDLIKYIQFCLPNGVSTEEKRNLLNMADTLKIDRNRAEEILLDEMNKAGVQFKSGSETTDSTDSSIPFDILLGQTYYEMLGLPEDADYAQIKEVYEREYKKYNTTRDKAKAEARWIPISKAWECLSDPVKRREYDEKLKEPKTSVPKGVPVLVVNRKSDADYTFKDIRKGTILSETIVIKNTEGGLLQGTIKSDVPWLEPDRNKILEKHEQDLYIRVLTSKIPAKSYKVDGKITIDTNGGTHIIPFTVFLENYKIELQRLRAAYVPFSATLFGFISSFITGPKLWDLAYITTIPFAIWYMILRIQEKGITQTVERIKQIGVGLLTGWIGGWLIFGGFNKIMYNMPHLTGFIMGAYLAGSLTYLLSRQGLQYFQGLGIDVSRYSPRLIHGASTGLLVFAIIMHSKSQPPFIPPSAPAPAPAPYTPAPAPAPTPAPAPYTPAPVPESSRIEIRKSAVAESVDQYDRPLGVATVFKEGSIPIYCIEYGEATPRRTRFKAVWYRDGNIIGESGEQTTTWTNGRFTHSLNTKLSGGNYEARLLVDGTEMSRSYFSVLASRQVSHPPLRSFEPPSQSLRSDGWKKSRESATYEDK